MMPLHQHHMASFHMGVAAQIPEYTTRSRGTYTGANRQAVGVSEGKG